MNFFIIHGVYGYPKENWFPWLKKELESRGYECIVPKFPTPFNQSLQSWLKVISKYKNKINEETVLIGHSLGAAFILNYLEQTNKKVKATFLVAGFHKPLGIQYDEINKTFVDKDFNWKKIKNSCNRFFVIASDNDEYIPLEINKELTKNLDVELKIIHDGGHLNAKSGFTNFPMLLDLILHLN